MSKYVNEMEDYLYNHNYISRNKNKDPFRQQELSIERASCIVQKHRTLTEEKDKEIERLTKEKKILELALRFVFQKDDDFKIDYNQLEKDLKELKEGK